MYIRIYLRCVQFKHVLVRISLSIASLQLLRYQNLFILLVLPMIPFLYRLLVACGCFTLYVNLLWLYLVLITLCVD